MLRFKPPGFTYPLDIPFPGRVLPVCARCKKNYKTREHCRTKEGHTGLPWTDTYMCITLDNTCFAPDGNMLAGPFHAVGVQSQPYVYPENMDLDPKTPSCAQCKDKNYTRTYCRTSKKHKTLPWSTVYVMLTLSRSADGSVPTPAPAPAPAPPATSTNSPDDGEASKKKRKLNDDAEEADKEEKSEKTDAKSEKKEDGESGEVKKEDSAEVKKEESEKADETPEDIFKTPHPSRTFLATVSVTKNEVKWVDLDQGAVAMMQHRAPKSEPVPATPENGGMYPPHMPYQMMPNGMHPMNMHHPMGNPMAPFPGMPSPHGPPGQGMPNGSGGKDDSSNRPPMDGQHQWGMGGGMPGQFPTPEMMYNAAQMMDPRMGGYGFNPGWYGRGYPMDMSGMQGGGPPSGQMGPGQMPYDSHMMQQMQWGGPQGGPQQGGGQMPPQGDMGGYPQGMPPGASPHGMHQGVPPHQGQGMPPPQAMSPQGPFRQHLGPPQQSGSPQVPQGQAPSAGDENGNGPDSAPGPGDSKKEGEAAVI